MVSQLKLVGFHFFVARFKILFFLFLATDKFCFKGLTKLASVVQEKITNIKTQHKILMNE